MRLGMSGFIETRPTLANYARQVETSPTLMHNIRQYHRYIPFKQNAYSIQGQRPGKTETKNNQGL